MTKRLSNYLFAITCISFMLVVSCGAIPSTVRYPGLFISADNFEWDTKNERLVLTEGSPTVVLTDRKVTFKADWIKVIFAKEEKGALRVDRILLHGGSPSVVSELQGIKLEAADIEIVAPKTEGKTGIDSAFAKGDVHLTQDNGDNKANATADSLAVSDGGDKAVMSGKVRVDARNAARHTTLAAATATMTGLRSLSGSPSYGHLIAEGGAAPAEMEVEGVLFAKAGKIDATQDRVLLTGGSPIVNWLEQKTTLEASEVSIFTTGTTTKGSRSQVDRVVLHGGSPKVASEPQGVTLTAADITVVPPKEKGQGSIESASANGKAHLVRSLGTDHLNSTSESLEISEKGDKAVLAGGVVMDISNSQYQGKLTGGTVTLTGLQASADATANRHLLAQGDATATVTGQMDAQADSIDITNERAILKGGSPKADIVQSKSSVEAGVITVFFVTAQGPKGKQLAVDSISLREGSPKIVLGQQGLTVTAEQIGASPPRGEGGGPMQSATASGKVHLVQSQAENSSDITADNLLMKDAGDTAVLTGNVVVITKSPQNSSEEHGDTATITHLLAKPGQQAAPHIVLEGKPGHIHVESTAPVKPSAASRKSSSKSKRGRHHGK